jgi:hypothetical protein
MQNISVDIIWFLLYMTNITGSRGRPGWAFSMHGDKSKCSKILIEAWKEETAWAPSLGRK